jgi:TolA-binding protein
MGLAVLGLGVAAGQGFVPRDRPADVPVARGAVEPIAPVLPAEVVAALQEGRFDDAIAALDKLAADPKAKPEVKSYAALVAGIAGRLAGKLDAARDRLAAAVAADPKGTWAAKQRAELAAVELAARRYAVAEPLARAEAEALLADGRKDRLAGVYRAFADRLMNPASQAVAPDFEGAHALLEQARNLAKGDDARADLLLAMARASQAVNNHPLALGELQAYLNEYPKGRERAAARFLLAESRLATGQGPAARMTWADLARDLQSVDTKEAQDARARSLYGIARTYNVPGPPNDSDLALGVAALKRLLSAYPSHPLAVRSAYQIGVSYLSRGKSQEALDAFTRFLAGTDYKADTDDARREQAEQLRAAQFQVGAILQGQEKFAEAIEAFRGYLAKFPNGPQSADAQRAILDTRLLIAQDDLRREQYEAARKAWVAFVAENPLDARVPQVLFQVGESYVPEKKYDEAIAAWEALAGKFPGTEPAAHGLFLIASLFENEKGDPATAIERFKKVGVEPWASSARQRIAVMESRALTVVTPRTFRSGETAHLKISTRNLEKLTFTAYKLNAEAYFRKKHALRNVESLDIGLVAADAEWTAEVPGYAKFKPIETTYELKVKVPGVYVVKVTDEKHLQATTLVLGSDLDVIVKASREQLLVFAQDMKTGKGRHRARVLLVGDDGGVTAPPTIPSPPASPQPEPAPPAPCAPGGADPAEAQALPVQAPPETFRSDGTTGKDGVLLKTWDKPRDPNAALHYLVIDGDDVAGSDLGVPDKVSQGLSPRAYLYTDRPAYRPGHDVQLKGVVREVVDGQYSNVPKATYRLEVTDARGRPFVAKPVTLTEFGTFAERIALDDRAPVGTYRVRLFQPGKSEFTGQFEVQAYQLEKVDLTIDLPKTVYFRGETVEGNAVARYQYGTPLAARPIALTLPDGRTLTGVTDATGKFHFSLETTGFLEEQPLRFVAQLPQDNTAAAAAVMLAVRAFSIGLSTKRDVYLDGESFRVDLATNDAQGQPTGQALSVTVLKVVEAAGRVTQREVNRVAVRTDDKTGKGSASIQVDDSDGGGYILRAAGTDRFNNPVIAERTVTISGKKDPTRLRILADRQDYKVGEEATVRLHGRGAGGTALLTWEADRILAYNIVTIKEGVNPITWAVDGAQFPNFTLTAARMAGTRFDEARLDVRVERDLQVTIKPTREVVGPNDKVEVEVTTQDQLGRPVAAELSIALVDEALLRRFRDNLPSIGPFFYNQARTGAFATAATNTFRYQPASVPVPQAVVDEAEKQAAREADRAAGEAGQAAARSEVAAMPAPAAEGSAGGAEGMAYRALGELGRDGRSGKMMGGMGGMGGGGRERKPGASTLKGAVADIDSLDVERAGVNLSTFDDAPKEADRKDYAFGAKAKRANRPGAPPRQAFVETAYWNPSVVTGKDGKARVTFRAPAALSKYRFTARGVTGADTLAGQATGSLAVRKEFFVDLRVPASLTEGDKPRLTARLHHAGGATGEAIVRLTAYAGDQEQVYMQKVGVKADGVDDVTFEPFEVPDAESVRFTVAARLGDANDELVAEVPIRPWGTQAFASASGTASDDRGLVVALPQGRKYDDPELVVVVSPSVRRMLVELALGRDVYPLTRRSAICFPIIPDTLADRASDLVAAASVLSYLKTTGGADAPEASRLADRVRSLVAELVTRQNDDGGWPWVGGGSDRAASARVVWALAAAEPNGLVPDPGSIERGLNYLAQEYPKVDGTDHETRAAILHALATRHRATFEQANALNRLRQNLSDVSLAYLALTFAELNRKELGAEVLGVLGPRAKSEQVAPGLPPRKYWDGSGPNPFHRGPAEATALATFAYARVEPGADVLKGAVEWLLAHRVGNGWQPHKAQGPALAALSAYYGGAKAADDRYRLAVTVNDEKVDTIEVDGKAEGKAIRVPVRSLKPGGNNRVSFDIEGRGTYSYEITLTGFTRDFGPDQDAANRSFVVHRRVYWPTLPELDGKPLPQGFGSAINPQTFENTITQLPVGGRASIGVEMYRNVPAGQPSWQRDFLVVREFLPAGTTLVEGSVRTEAAHHTLEDGVLTAYFTPDQNLGIIYDVYGYLPGQYRALPVELSSAYEPGRRHLGQPSDLKVLRPGEPSTDPRRATPDELYARGKTLFDAGRLAEAAEPLESLWSAYTLRDDVAKDAARMLLVIHIKDDNPRKVVQYFEVLKEKAPELVVPFDQIKVVGRAYADIGEHERAYLVWRATAEASYLEDARVGEVLRQRGRTLEALAFLLRLWREYPSTASIDADFFGLSQILGSMAVNATNDPNLRHEMADAGVNRIDLLLQESRLIQVFLSQSPKNPLADEASLALLGAFMEMEDYESVVKLARRYAGLYPKSTFLDSFQYSEALGRFHRGEYDRAIEVAEAIAKATYTDANGVDQPSPNKWQALYILGQIYDARRKPAEAVAYYERVADRFTDAADAVRSLTRKALALPEVTVLRPPVAGNVAGVGLRAIPIDKPADPGDKDKAKDDKVRLDYRNVAEADVKVYPVDLMRLYLSRRTLDGIAGIDLAGITPLYEKTVKLHPGADFQDHVKALELPLEKEGAYLVMVRGEDLYASGIALVTPLSVEVREEPTQGRVRVTVRDARTGEFVPKVQVKVIGTQNPQFLGGETDLRGVYVAEGVVGQVTAVARRDAQYAFYRGTTHVGAPPAPAKPADAPAGANAPGQQGGESLEQNLRRQNSTNQEKQMERLRGRYNAMPAGVQVEGVK